jgi:hypothetical protein
MNNRSRTMTESEREATRRRLQIWQEAQPLLEEQRWRELMALTDAQALKLTESLLGRKGIVPEPRDNSGLVDQQALFQRSQRR